MHEPRAVARPRVNLDGLRPLPGLDDANVRNNAEMKRRRSET